MPITNIGDPLEVIGEFAFQNVLKNLSIKDRINIELVSKGWKEASSKSWNQIDTLDLSPFLKPLKKEERKKRFTYDVPKHKRIDLQRAKAVLESLWKRAGRGIGEFVEYVLEDEFARAYRLEDEFARAYKQRAKAVLESLWKRAGRYVKTLKMNLHAEDAELLTTLDGELLTGFDKVLVEVLRESPPERMEHLRLKGLPLDAETMEGLLLLFMESKGGPQKIRSLEWGLSYKWISSCDFCTCEDEAVYKRKLNSLVALLHSCSGLKKLHISHFPPVQIAVQSIPESVEDLRIHFCFVPHHSQRVECEWLSKPQLKKIRIDNYGNESNPLNLDAFSVCKQLESVRFSRVHGGFRDPKWLTELCLQELELNGISPPLGDGFFVPCFHAAHNAPIAQSLKSLNLNEKNCGPGTVKAIAVFSHLENLRLRWCSNLDDDLNYILPACPHIKKLILRPVTNRTMAIVGQQCKNLEKFVIRHYTADVLDTGVKNLVIARFQPNQSISPPFLHIFTRAHKIKKDREFHPLVKAVEGYPDDSDDSDAEWFSI